MISLILQDTDIEEDLIPDVYKLSLKKNSKIDLDKLNSSLQKISADATIFFTNKKLSKFLYQFMRIFCFKF